MEKQYVAVDYKTVTVTEPITTTIDLEALATDITTRQAQIQIFNDQKAAIDIQIKVQQDMIDQDQATIDEITKNVVLPAKPIDVQNLDQSKEQNGPTK